MLETRINFQQIRDRVEAAERLQDAGQNDDSADILKKLADDITRKLKKR